MRLNYKSDFDFFVSIKKIGDWNFDPSTQYIITFLYGTAAAVKAA